MSIRPILLAWSSGKDCAHALAVLRADPTVEVRALLTTLSAPTGRVAMHGVRRQLLQQQARALGLPLIQVELPQPCPNDAYERAMRSTLEPIAAQGIEAIAFGDLFLEDIRAYREEKNRALGFDSLFPLFGRDTTKLASEMVSGGLRAKLVCVDTRRVPLEFAGREFDAALLAELPSGVDPCGENGEFHTFAYDGPCFDRPIAVRVGEINVEDGYATADLLPAG